MPRHPRVLIVALLTLALMLAAFVPADAGAARSPSYAIAKRLAVQLLNQQLHNKKRKLTEARITEGVKTKNGTWEFLYDDLSKDGVICTGVIAVRYKPAGGTRIVGNFLSGKCERPGAEVLGFRTASRAADRSLLRSGPAVQRSLKAYARALKPCDSLQIPDNRQVEVARLLDAGQIEATVKPLDRTVDRFASALEAIGSQQTNLASGASAWRDFVDAERALPALSPNVCSVLRTWAKNNWTTETAPVDFEALTGLEERILADGRRVKRTARYLKGQGVDVLTVDAFTLRDLNSALFPPRVASAGKTVRALAR
jgi:hypothetical protein